jgi:hypothetical protein
MLSEPELSHVMRGFNPSADTLALNKTENEIKSMIGQIDNRSVSANSGGYIRDLSMNDSRSIGRVSINLKPDLPNFSMVLQNPPEEDQL